MRSISLRILASVAALTAIGSMSAMAEDLPELVINEDIEMVTRTKSAGSSGKSR